MTQQRDPAPSPPAVDSRRELALLRATEAPIIFFHGAPSYSVRNGVANVTLDGGIHLTLDGRAVDDVRTVATSAFRFRPYRAFARRWTGSRGRRSHSSKSRGFCCLVRSPKH
jgi:hypothetical protein